MPKKVLLRKNLTGIRALKDEAHDMIDAIVRTGISKTGVYKELALRLGIAYENAHFGKMYTEREVRRAHAAVKRLYEERKETIRKRRHSARLARKKPVAAPKPADPPKPRNKDVLPLAEQKAAIAAMHVKVEATSASPAEVKIEYESTDGGVVKKKESWLTKLTNFLWND